MVKGTDKEISIVAWDRTFFYLKQIKNKNGGLT
jgi:hypothetical protein